MGGMGGYGRVFYSPEIRTMESRFNILFSTQPKHGTARAQKRIKNMKSSSWKASD